MRQPLEFKNWGWNLTQIIWAITLHWYLDHESGLWVSMPRFGPGSAWDRSLETGILGGDWAWKARNGGGGRGVEEEWGGGEDSPYVKEYLIKNVSIFLRNSSPLLRRFYFFSLRPPEDEIYAGVPADFVDVSFGRISALRPWISGRNLKTDQN